MSSHQHLMWQSFRASRLAMVAFVAGAAALAGCVDDPAEPGSAPTGQVEQASGADASCTNWVATGQGPLGGPNSVAADCRQANGVFHHTEVWLPGCLGNNNGLLVWSGNGFFDRSCNACSVGIDPSFGPTWICSCANAAGQFQRAAAILGVGLTNSNGNLVCP